METKTENRIKFDGAKSLVELVEDDLLSKDGLDEKVYLIGFAKRNPLYRGGLNKRAYLATSSGNLKCIRTCRRLDDSTIRLKIYIIKYGSEIIREKEIDINSTFKLIYDSFVKFLQRFEE